MLVCSGQESHCFTFWLGERKINKSEGGKEGED